MVISHVPISPKNVIKQKVALGGHGDYSSVKPALGFLAFIRLQMRCIF